MQEQNTVNFDEVIAQARKQQAEAVFNMIQRGLMLLKLWPGKKTPATSARKGLAAPTGHTLA